MPPPLGSWRFQYAMAALAAGFGVFAVGGWRDVHVIPAHWVAHAIVIAGVWGLGALLARARLDGRGRRFAARASDACVSAGWALLCGAVTAPVTYAAMRAPLPLHDTLLAVADAGIGLPVPRVQAWLSVLPAATWWRIYDLLPPLLASAALLTPLSGRVERTRVLLFAYMGSFLLAMPILLTFQALGPWAAYGYLPAPTQADYVRELTVLKQPGAFTFDPTRIVGVVTFPSFHALLAVLGGWALAPVRWVGPLAVVVTAGIVLATVATGWHYTVDAIAGVLLAAGALGVARLGERWWGLSA